MWYPPFPIFPISRSQSQIACWLTRNLSSVFFCVCEFSPTTTHAISHLRIYWAIFHIPCVQQLCVQPSSTRILLCQLHSFTLSHSLFNSGNIRCYCMFLFFFMLSGFVCISPKLLASGFDYIQKIIKHAIRLHTLVAVALTEPQLIWTVLSPLTTCCRIFSMRKWPSFHTAESLCYGFCARHFRCAHENRTRPVGAGARSRCCLSRTQGFAVRCKAPQGRASSIGCGAYHISYD